MSDMWDSIHTALGKLPTLEWDFLVDAAVSGSPLLPLMKKKKLIASSSWTWDLLLWSLYWYPTWHLF